ncbi:3-ketoacyl-CoA synthase 11, partial [Manihot esculenta]|uniref:3-ketoacyl-CoA synthase 11 n=1 Tax=Manihot esculenta TaxID=3983 RepID=UPI001CC537C8
HLTNSHSQNCLLPTPITLFLTPFLGMTLVHYSMLIIENLIELWNRLTSNLEMLVISSTFILIIITLYFMRKPRKIYLVDFACYKPAPSYKCPKEHCMKVVDKEEVFTEESLEFVRKILEKSGIGQDAYGSNGVLQIPQDLCMAEARKETEMVVFGAVDELLAKTGVKPADIGILVVNSSVFNPQPSLSAMIVNRYKLRGNVLSYNLGGMGCSAGLISIHLAKDLLQVHPNSYALVVSTENATSSWYEGNERSMLITNCLFRVGGVAVLLSNRSFDRRCSKYQLMNSIRTHKGADDKSYNCVMQREDKNDAIGISLSKELVGVAGDALKANITTLGPLVLPLFEQLKFLATLIMKKILKIKIKSYIPDFKLAFEHFCIHPGGRAVLDTVEKSLDLTEWHMEPSRMTLYRFANTSSTSIWYELAYSEAKGRIKKGNRVWQLGFGSGFKCNSVVWRALRSINPANEENPWIDEINDFPVHIPKATPVMY